MSYLATTRTILGKGSSLNYLDEASLRAAMGKEDIELRQYRRFKRDGVEHLQIIALARNAEAVFRSGIFGAFRLHQEGSGAFSVQADIPAIPATLSAERLQELRALCEGLDLALVLVAPENIVAGNGKLSDPKTMVWQWEIERDAAAPALFRQSFPKIAMTWKK